MNIIKKSIQIVMMVMCFTLGVKSYAQNDFSFFIEGSDRWYNQTEFIKFIQNEVRPRYYNNQNTQYINIVMRHLAGNRVTFRLQTSNLYLVHIDSPNVSDGTIRDIRYPSSDYSLYIDMQRIRVQFYEAFYGNFNSNNNTLILFALMFSESARFGPVAHAVQNILTGDRRGYEWGALRPLLTNWSSISRYVETNGIVPQNEHDLGSRPPINTSRTPIIPISRRMIEMAMPELHNHLMSITDGHTNLQNYGGHQEL